MAGTLTRRRWLAGAASLPWAAGPAARAAAPSGALRLVGPWELPGLEPASSGHFFLRLQVAETLLDADDAGRPLPGLASRWQRAPDGLHWRFTLRPGARFHDGTPVEAEAVARALRRAHARPGLLRLAPLAEVQAEGAQQLRLRLREPFEPLPALLAHSSAIVLAPASFDTRDRVQAVVGSGPYRVRRLAAPQRIDVEALEARLTVRQAGYLSASRAETRALMAESGDADLAFALDPASLARLRTLPQVRVLQVTVPRTLILKVNSGHRWLADRRAREALSLSLDRAGIARGLLRDGELAATQLLPPTLAGWHRPELPPLAFDPAAARERWAMLGWRPGADGLLQRDGERFTLTLRTFPDRPELPLVATAVQEQLRQTGIACRVLIGNSGDVPLRHHDGSLELALAARHYALAPDPLVTLLQDFADGGGDWGAMNWRHAGLQQAFAALQRGEGAVDAGRARVLHVLHEELPVIPIAWYRQSAAVTPSLAGLALDPLERSWRLATLPLPGALR